jgi:hypothetical protein
MNTSVSTLAAFSVLAALASAQDADLAPRPSSSRTLTPVVRPAGTGNAKAALYTNGTYVTQTGVGFGGADVSEIELGSIIFGYGDSQAASQRIADDFTVPAGETWTLDQLLWHGYQTGAPTTGTINGITVEALDGAPSLGGSPVAGDTTTNRFVSQTWTGVYRVTSTTLTSTARAIFDVAADLTAFAPLASGSYWLSVDMAGTLSSGPWCPPTVPSLPSDNAEQFTGSWAPIFDTGTGQGHDMWFHLDGTSGGGGTGPGTPYCFGVNCPCGNDDPGAGCVNSSGVGGLLDGFGTSSVAAADLGLSLSGLPTSCVTLILLGAQTGEKPFKDGKLCLSGTIWRLWKHFNSGQTGAFQVPEVANLFAIGGPYIVFAPGETWNFQSWYRDPPASSTACGMKSNLTNGYTVTFQP